MYCTRCGHRNPQDARFCAKCGHPLQDETTLNLAQVELEDETGEDIHLPLDQLNERQALLVVKRGPNAGSQLLIEKDVTTTGRHPESDIFLDDITVSRRHAEFRRKDERFQIHDMGSLNGTYVNRNRVETTELASGDEIQIGKFKLMFFAGKGE
ncbi:MAG TPA: FHA domain-containing protein [Actinomycetota bacterium]|nr:FHA domain-containing protein [Actinomycetota bacterium]